MKKAVSLILAVLMLACSGAAWAEKLFDTWFLRDVLDDFDEPSGEVYPAYVSKNGEFTDWILNEYKAGLTMGLTFSVAIQRDEDGQEAMAFKLFEYHNNLVENTSLISDEPIYYRISFKDKDKQKGSLRGCMLHGESTIWLMDGFELIDGPKPIIEALKKGGTVQFVITQEDEEDIKYKFSVDASNFSEILEEHVNTYEKYLNL